MANSKLAGDVTLLKQGDLMIDGDEFPWPYTDVTVQYSADALSKLVITIPFTGSVLATPQP